MKKLFLFALSLLLVSAPVGGAEPGRKLSFERDVAPILRVYCWSCHGSGGLDGGLDLRSRPLAVRGGKHGPAIVPGAAEKSLLYKRLVAREMPPEKTHHKNVVFSPVKPTKKHLATIKLWIDQGAVASYRARSLNDSEDPVITDEDRSWWAFIPPRRVRLPRVRQQQRVQTGVDTFVLARLEARNLSLAPRASRLALIRRLYLDVTGIPPTPEKVDSFVRDKSPDSYQRLVEEVLSSPGFGERWGRHWLDAAGYVDTGGRDNDANIINMHEGRWRYRDYVIGSLNRDKPYDQFVTEQLAGDELVDWRNAQHYTERIRELLIATGYLRMAADSTGSRELNTGDIRNQVLIETVRVVGSNLLGLTIQCAQCHTHKFDPFSHADYYRFRSFFEPGYNLQQWKGPKERLLFTVSDVERKAIDQSNARIKQKVASLTAAIKKVRDQIRGAISARKTQQHVPRPLVDDVRKALATPAKKRSTIQKYLASKFTAALAVSEAEVDGRLTAEQKKTAQQQQNEIARLNRQRRTYGRFPALWEETPPPKSYLFRRGEFEKPGPEVQASIPGVLRVARMPARVKPPNRRSSGFRLQLARWMTAKNHPLVARVFVNRIWQRYFGRGIVATPDNFGVSGAKPTHPQLLDWLALELVEGGWSIKAIHRKILLSATYQQATYRADEDQRSSPAKVDPANQLLWKMPLRRMPAEIVRDNVLAVAGSLVQRGGGQPVPIQPKPDGMVEIDAAKLVHPGDPFRRTVYLTARRNYHLTQLDVFNQPLVTPNCTRRIHSPIVSQSLAMLNGKFVVEQSHQLARRVAQRSNGAEEAIRNGFQIVLCRAPSNEELQAGLELVADVKQKYRASGKSPAEAQQQSLQHFCHMLLNTSEFLYIP